MPDETDPRDGRHGWPEGARVAAIKAIDARTGPCLQITVPMAMCLATDILDAVALLIAERGIPDPGPETALSDALHTLGQVQRIAESMARSGRADDRERETEQECGRRILAAIGPQGDEEPALPVAAELDGPEIDGQLPLPGVAPPEQTRPWPYDGPEGRARLTGNTG